MVFFEHQPFQKPLQIRLVVLHPLQESRDGRFYCHIVHTELENPPSYEAISYTWGTSIQDQQIIVVSPEDGSHATIKATKSLIEVFARLRLPSKSRTIWIDQLSIDQFDHDEKRVQIHYMWKVYQNATRTIIWLGEATKETLESLQVTKTIAGMQDSETGGEVEAHIDILEALYKSRWFSRIWCIQEVCFSKEPVVMLGAERVDWSTISRACDCIATPLEDFVPQQNAVLMTKYRNRIQDNRRCDLLTSLAETRRFECTVPEDRLHAINGMATHNTLGEDIGKEPGESDVHRLWPAFAAMYIEYAVNNGWPSTLDSITHAGTRNSTPDWPTWAPDWTYEKARDRPTEPYFSVNLHRFNASRGRSLGDAALRYHTYHYNVLSVQGRIFDTIRILGEVYPNTNWTVAQEFFQWWLLAKDVIGDTYSTGESTAKCFGRTIAADFYLENSPQMHPEFTALYLECCLRYLEDRWPTEHPWLVPAITKCFERFHGYVARACRGQRFFISTKGYMGLCPPETLPGDEIVVLYGGKSPFILRRTSAAMVLRARVGETETKYTNYALSIDKGAGHSLIGDCYVDGIMHGEALDLEGTDRGFVIV